MPIAAPKEKPLQLLYLAAESLLLSDKITRATAKFQTLTSFFGISMAR